MDGQISNCVPLRNYVFCCSSRSQQFGARTPGKGSASVIPTDRRPPYSLHRAASRRRPVSIRGQGAAAKFGLRNQVEIPAMRASSVDRMASVPSRSSVLETVQRRPEWRVRAGAEIALPDAGDGELVD